MKLYNYPDILTIDDVMDILHIGRGQCYDYLKSGLLKGFKLGVKTWKIPKDSVIEFIETQAYSKTFS